MERVGKLKLHSVCVFVPRRLLLYGRLSSRYVGAPHSLRCWLVGAHCIATRSKRNRIYQRLLFIARLVRSATSSDQSTLIYHSLRITVTKVHIHMICCWHPSSCPLMRWVGLDWIRAANYKMNERTKDLIYLLHQSHAGEQGDMPCQVEEGGS